MRGIAIILLVLFVVGCQKRNGQVDPPPREPARINPQSIDQELFAILNKSAKQQGKNDYSFFMQPESDEYDKIPQDPKNSLNTYKVRLGKRLFHETALATLSADTNHLKTYSCSSCHSMEHGLSSANFQAVAEGGIDSFEERRPDPSVDTETVLDVQPIKAMANLNLAWQKNTLWNGQFGATGKNIGTEDKWKEGTHLAYNKLGFEGIETQAIAGLEAHKLISEFNDEMKLKFNDSLLKSNEEYIELFKHSFPHEVIKITHINAALAIAAYERTLLSNRAPFQKWLRGKKSAMTDTQKKGAVLFFGKANCVQCHTGPALNSNDFHALGFKDLRDRNDVVIKAGEDAPHKGRGSFTEKESDDFKFKVPQLYNLKKHVAFGHGNSFPSIKEVIRYKNNAQVENKHINPDQLSKHFVKLNLNEDEVNQLTEFVTEALFDPELKRYLPSSIPSGQCFPNNDLVSQGKNCL